MLSQASKEEIFRKLEASVGHPVTEEGLSPGNRRAVANLAEIQRNLFAISEVLNGEQSRIKRSALLSFASKLHKDDEMEKHGAEVKSLQTEVDNKISEISAQILREDEAMSSGLPLPERQGGLDAVELKCPNCGAVLPMPNGRFVKCQYCSTTLSIQDVSSQIRSMIQSI
jgi:DNA-directed RNA polymerase subunit RPC12/RpoP